MQIVTDSGTDLSLTTEERQQLKIHVVPLSVTLDGVTYREGLDITTEAFYDLLEASENLPTTSQPPAGEFAELYRKLAAEGEDIISIHISSGLSGTFNSALAGAAMVPEAKVTHIDARTLSAAAGWQVEAAARAAAANWSLERIQQLVAGISRAADSIYTLKELKYLIHGGRISHMKGLIANLLNIKPLIGVEKESGTYMQQGQVRSFTGALRGLADLVEKLHAAGSQLRMQVLHANNPEGAAELRALLEARFDCAWRPLGPMSLVLGAHTGPSMVGVACAPQNVFEL